MRSSSFVFIFILGLFFQNRVNFELYYVLVDGPKKNCTSQCSSSGRKFFRCQNVFKVPEYYLIAMSANIQCTYCMHAEICGLSCLPEKI